MKRQSRPPEPANSETELRQRAEARLAEKTGASAGSGGENSRRLLHELRVHQLELEMQNEELRQRERELVLKKRIAEIFLSQPYDQMFSEVLKVVQEAAASRFGLFGYLDGEGSLVVPSLTDEIWEECQVFEKKQVFSRDKLPRLSFTRALREKRTICSNDPPRRLPTGHLPLANYLSLPVLIEDKTIGLLQVADKEGDYSEDDICLLEEITFYLAPLLQARLEHKRAKELVTNVMESIDEGFVIIDRDFRIISSNQAYAEGTNRSPGEIIGRHCYEVSHHSDQPCFLCGEECAVKQVFDTNQSSVIIHTHYDSQGQPLYVETKAFPLDKNETGEVETAIEIVTDITEKKRRDAEIHSLAFYDPLTGVANRRLFRDRLQQACASSSRSGQYWALLFMDLDNFKNLNDTYGHEAGDLLLQETARRLQATIREEDTISRQGGDEFVVLLGHLSGEEKDAIAQAGHVAQKISSRLERPFSIYGCEHQLTVSIGITIFQDHEKSWEELFKHADAAMYQAKQDGRNTVRFFDPSMQATLEKNYIMGHDLRLAIQEEQFQLYYQPQNDVHGRITGGEALLRWFHPSRGMVFPLDFISLVEENGLILPIGKWVIETACRQIKAWAGMTGVDGLRLAINVSARQFHQPRFMDEVREFITASAIEPARLKLELTESLVLQDLEDTIHKMKTLQAMGVGFSMDDFGTGYSSLAKLKYLPFEQLKIDRAFVRDLGSDPYDAAIVRTIINMGQTLEFETVAEGVETREQLDFLASHGCTTFQGYFFSPPVPEEEFTRMLQAGTVGGD